MSTSSIFGPIDESEETTTKISIDEIIKFADLIFQIKKEKEESNTIIRVSNSKRNAFNARINYLKKNGIDIDLFDLAGNSKKRLKVYYKREKYSRKN